MKTLCHTVWTILFSCLSYISYSQSFNCPPNIDFEQGNLNNWQFFIGNCCPTNTSTATPAVVNRHVLVTGTGTDFYGGFPVVAPNGGNYSFKLGNRQVGARAERARYYVQVPSGSNNIYTLMYNYAVVLQDPQHPPEQQPSFEVSVYDSATGIAIPCNQFKYVASSNLPGFKLSTQGGNVYYKDWSTASIELSGLNGKTIAIDFTTTDCGAGAHFGYAYIDLSCGFFKTHTLYCKNVATVTLTAPPGFQNYQWYDSTTGTNVGNGEIITIPTPPAATTFGVILTPYIGFGCPDTLFKRFRFENMVTNTTNDTVVCRDDSLQMFASINSTDTPIQYVWTPSTFLSCINCANPIAKTKI